MLCCMRCLSACVCARAIFFPLSSYIQSQKWKRESSKLELKWNARLQLNWSLPFFRIASSRLPILRQFVRFSTIRWFLRILHLCFFTRSWHLIGCVQPSHRWYLFHFHWNRQLTESNKKNFLILFALICKAILIFQWISRKLARNIHEVAEKWRKIKTRKINEIINSSNSDWPHWGFYLFCDLRREI